MRFFPFFDMLVQDMKSAIVLAFPLTCICREKNHRAKSFFVITALRVLQINVSIALLIPKNEAT